MQRNIIKAIAPILAEIEETEKLYRAAVDIVDIKGLEHLLIDIYRTEKESELLYRIVINEKEYQNYSTRTDTWDAKKIQPGIAVGYVETLDEKRIFFSKKDSKKIKGFNIGKKQTYRCSDTAFYTIREYQDYIDYNRAYIRDENKKQQLQERIENTPELPDEFMNWLEKDLFGNIHYMYYKRTGNKAKIKCSACGLEYTIRTRATTGGYEEQLGTWGEVPKHNNRGKCNNCGIYGVYKAEGKQDNTSNRINVYVNQRYTQGDRKGIVTRYFNCIKQTHRCADSEGLRVYEIERAYFIEGEKRIQIDYQKHSSWDGRDFWDYKNLSGMVNIIREKGVLYKGNTKELKGTEFEYTGIDTYQFKNKEIDVINYYSAYRAIPDLELVVKTGMYELADRIVETRGSLDIDINKKHTWDRFKIKKEDMKYLAKKQGEYTVLKMLKFECKNNIRLTDEQRELFCKLNSNLENLSRILPYVTTAQFLNRIQKYSGIDIAGKPDKFLCGRGLEQINNTANKYLDYLIMRLDLGYNLHNTVFQYPKNLDEEHNKMALQQNELKNRKRIMEMQEKYPQIEKQYKKLLKKYKYEEENLIIRPTMNAGEIILEGRSLHHCVGGEHFIKNHNAGRNLILFMRKKNQPDIPYVTIELDTTTKNIVQWYGANNKKPDEKHLNKLLNHYLERIAGEKPEAIVKAAGEENGRNKNRL